MNLPSLQPVLSRLRGAAAAKTAASYGSMPVEQLSADWADRDPSDTPTTSGEQVTVSSALRLTAVWRAVRLLSETIAALPLVVYERTGPRSKARATGHPLYTLLHDRPHPAFTRFNYFELVVQHLELRGNFFALKVVNPRTGDIDRLVPIHPDTVTVYHRGGNPEELVYQVRLAPGVVRVFFADEILHIPGFGTGQVGYSTVYWCADALGLTQAAERHTGGVFRNGARPSGVLEAAGVLKDESYNRLRKEWREKYQGTGNAGAVVILEQGLKYSGVSMNNVDAQLLESRKFQVSDIARIFGIPPHMLGDLERSTNNNIEQQSIDFVVNCLVPRCTRIEQALGRALFSGPEYSRYYPSFIVEGRLRGDVATRSKAERDWHEGGILSADEIREIEDRNPRADGNGGRYWRPANIVWDETAGSDTKPAPAAAKETP